MSLAMPMISSEGVLVHRISLLPSALAILFGEAAPLDDPYSHRFVIARTDVICVEGHLLVWQTLATFDEDAAHIAAAAERHHEPVAHALRSGYRGQPFNYLLLQGATTRLVVLFLVEFQRRHQHAFRLIAGVNRQQVAQTLDTQPGSDQYDHRQRELRHNQQAAEAESRRTPIENAAFLLQGGDKVCLRSLP